MSNSINSNGNEKKDVQVKVRRFNPAVDQEAHWQTYKVPRDQVARLLDVVEYICKHLDPTLAIRPHYCRDLVCNACFINFNGKPRMSCMTLINDSIEELTIEPQKGYRVIRDLVVDFSEKTEVKR